MFFIIHDDKPIFELNFLSSEKQIKECFLVHSSLDVLEHMITAKRDFYLGMLKSDDLSIYAYLNPVGTQIYNSGLKFILVLGGKKEHDKSMDKPLKEFFMKINQALALALLNPLYVRKTSIKSALFDERVRSFAKENLRPYIIPNKK